MGEPRGYGGRDVWDWTYRSVAAGDDLSAVVWMDRKRSVRTGHLFQGRFGAVVMDEPHLLRRRYIALNPVVGGG
jgi:hypothetical protein